MMEIIAHRAPASSEAIGCLQEFALTVSSERKSWPRPAGKSVEIKFAR